MSRTRELLKLKGLLSSHDVPAVQVIGPPGSGKTTIIKMLTDAYKQEFKGRVFYVGNPTMSPIGLFIDSKWEDVVSKLGEASGSNLVIWDDFDDASALRASHVLERIRNVNPKTEVVFTSRHMLTTEDVPEKVEIEGLDFDEFSALCNMLINAPTPELVRKLHKEVQGNPLAIKLIADASMGDAMGRS